MDTRKQNETRQLGLAAAIAVVTGESIALGIFLTPAAMAKSLGSPLLLALVWLAIAMMAMCGDLCYSELAIRFPESGGEYVYLRESFGGLAAFLTGWTSFVAGFSGGIAAGAVGVTAYIDHFVPGAADATVWASWSVGPLSLTLSTRSLLAIAIIFVLAIIHVRGLGPGRLFQNALTVVKIGALTAFVVVGLSMATRLPPRNCWA